jgi:hypothetical protein
MDLINISEPLINMISSATYYKTKGETLAAMATARVSKRRRGVKKLH